MPVSAAAPLSRGTEPGMAIEEQMDAWLGLGLGSGCEARNRATVGAASERRGKGCGKGEGLRGERSLVAVR